jgi:TatD DNase family protein
MRIIDTHTHIYLPEFDDDRESMLFRAEQAGVTDFLLPNVDAKSIPALIKLYQENPDTSHPMMGLHPCSVKEDFEAELKLIKGVLFGQPELFVAVGEIGIDMYWDKSTLQQQQIAFATQIHWALELDKPIAIHCREAFDEIFEVLEKIAAPNLKGVFHCFTGNLEQAHRAIDLGLHLGIGGVATFKNGGLDRVLPEIDLKHILLETDAPYLAPVPYRGKRNEPSYLTYVVAQLAHFYNTTPDHIAQVTTSNATKLFEL